MTLAVAGRRLALSIAVGATVAGLALLGHDRTAAGAHGACFSALRLLRHAIATFEAQHGFLPGRLSGDAAPEGLTDEQAAALATLQLTRPRSAAGFPSRSGPWPGLLDAIPVNPFTGSAALIVVPASADALGLAAVTDAGWAYLLRDGHDSAGALPAGLVVPCGTTPDGPLAAGVPTVQQIAFEIEDFERWR